MNSDDIMNLIRTPCHLLFDNLRKSNLLTECDNTAIIYMTKTSGSGEIPNRR